MYIHMRTYMDIIGMNITSFIRTIFWGMQKGTKLQFLKKTAKMGI